MRPLLALLLLLLLPAGALASPLPSGRDSYRHLADYQADMARLVTAHPGLVVPVTLPQRTVQGRAITGVEITHDAGNARDGKPVFLQLGLHHAREWPSGESAMEFAFDLVRSDGTDPVITALLDRVRVVVVPVVNVDGFVSSRESSYDPMQPGVTDLTSLTEMGAYRRRNCSATPPGAPCGDDVGGVDLNRNYGINWGGNGASSFANGQDFRGAAPFSEPESRAVREFVRSRQVTLLLTNHTAGKMVLRPPGAASVGTVPDEAGLKALGDAFAAQNGYLSQRSYELYDNSGTTEDWSYGVTGGYGFTFEINDQGFHPAYQGAVVDEYLGTGPTAGKGNRGAYLLGLAHAADPAHHARIEGTAPAGRVLRIERKVDSLTSPVCLAQPTGFASTPCGPTGAPIAFSDTLTSSYAVPADGRIAWHVNQSNAPLGKDDGIWRLTCEDAAGAVLERREVRVARGAVAQLDLRCGTSGLTRCTPTPGTLRSVSARAARGGLRVRARATGPVRLDVFKLSRGRAVTGARRVLRGVAVPALVRTARLTPGAYVIRVRAADGAARRVALLVDARHRVRVLGPYERSSLCGLLRSVRLVRPVAGGSSGAPVLLRVDALPGTTVVAEVRRGSRRLSRVRVPAGRASLRVGGSGARTVRVTASRGGTTTRSTLAVRGL